MLSAAIKESPKKEYAVLPNGFRIALKGADPLWISSRD